MCSNISRIADGDAADGDSHAFEFFLLWVDLTDNRGEGGIFAFFSRYVIMVDNKEGIHTLDALSCDLCFLFYPLVEAAHQFNIVLSHVTTDSRMEPRVRITV